MRVKVWGASGHIYRVVVAADSEISVDEVEQATGDLTLMIEDSNGECLYLAPECYQAGEDAYFGRDDLARV